MLKMCVQDNMYDKTEAQLEGFLSKLVRHIIIIRVIIVIIVMIIIVIIIIIMIFVLLL
jgi:hypothetical protein